MSPTTDLNPRRPSSPPRPALAWLVALALVPALAAPAADAEPTEPPDASADVLVLRRCAVDYAQTATLGASQSGIIQECLVEPGDRVKAGQRVGRLADADLRAELKLREMEAKSDLEVRITEAKSAQALIKVRTTAALVRRNAASQEEYNLQRMEAEAATLAIEQAKQNHRLAQIKFEMAQAQLRAREFISPLDGVVIAVLKRRGEPVAPNEPLFKIVDTEHLQITAQVDVTDTWRMRRGQPVKIVPEIAGADLPLEREEFTGRIVFIDTHVDPLSQTCKVLVRADNRRGLLRAGIEARIEVAPRATTEIKPPPVEAKPPALPARPAPTARLTGARP
jgi:RND family efflux transporter MFP subunit